MSEYGGLLTLHGQQDLAQAAAGGPAITFTHIAVGDGGGVSYDPVESQTALANERGRYAVTSVAVQPDGRIVAIATVPADAGGWHIREAGLITSAGRLAIICKYPPMFKPGPGSGGALSLEIAIVADLGNAPTSAVTLTIQSSAVVGMTRLSRAPHISVDAIADTAPSNPAAGALIAVDFAPTGLFGGRAGQLAEFLDGAWSFKATVPTSLIRLPDGTFRQRAAGAWQVWNPTIHTHLAADITNFTAETQAIGDGRYLRKNASDTVTLPGATHGFQNIRLDPASASLSRSVLFKTQDDAFARFELHQDSAALRINAYDPATGAIVGNRFSFGADGICGTAGPFNGLLVTDRAASDRGAALYADAGTLALTSWGAGPGDLIRLRTDGSAQTVWRDGAYRQIATENRAISAGTGLTGGGSLAADRTLAIDQAWLSAFIGRRIVAAVQVRPGTVSVWGCTYQIQPVHASAWGIVTFSSPLPDAQYEVIALYLPVSPTGAVDITDAVREWTGLTPSQPTGVSAWPLQRDPVSGKTAGWFYIRSASVPQDVTGNTPHPCFILVIR